MQIREIVLAPILLSSAVIALSPQAAAPDKALDVKSTVCWRGCEFSSLSAAIKSSPSGGIVSVAPGIYDTCGVVDKPLHLIGLVDASGKRAHLAGVCWGKGALVLRATDIVIQGFEISSIAVPDKNGACIEIDAEAGNITIRDLYCHDSEDGILGGPREGSVTIEDFRFERNGSNRGLGHGIYINSADNFILRHSQIISTTGKGHTLKSGARRTVIEDSILAALGGQNSRAIDAYAGGVLVVRRSVIEQGKNSDNNEAIGIALEPKRINPKPHSTLVEDSWIIFDNTQRCCRMLLRAEQLGPITIRRNKIIASTAIADSNLTALDVDNRLYHDRAEAGLINYDGNLSSLPNPGPR